MSQELQRQEEQEPIKYGEVFHVQGELTEKPVSRGDASMIPAFENSLLGKTQKGGAAAVMQSVASLNEKLVQQTDSSGKRTMVMGCFTGRMVLEQYSQAVLLSLPKSGSQHYCKNLNDAITIGEALEATVLTAGNKPVEWSDAAAIQAAEVRATGSTSITPGGIAARAQSAATLNARTSQAAEKIKLADILTNATVRLPADKPVTRKDAEGVTGAEMRNDPNLTTHPAGVAASVAAAARLNQIK